MSPAAGTILIVEDDELVRDALTDVLERAGYGVLASSSCDDALAYLLRATPPALVLLDIMMPGMPADRFRRLLEQEPVLADLPLVVMTAKALPPGYAYPWARATLLKPVHAGALLEAVRTHAGESRTSPSP
ncbi:response regulator [Anaeromyxobacter oryzae]|uniref:response regulator n=1 Tax=Anaeromyxobacter oryzae TaxID=2918170 RepID=UPI0020BDF5E3|nr:response regulator [Anaeromyxobacter oryzae]